MIRLAFPAVALLALVSCGGEAETAPDPQQQIAQAPESTAQTELPAAPNSKPGKSAWPAVSCGPKEVTIWSCTMENGKTLSVCSTGGSTATYRFGREEPELELQGGSWARVGYSGGGELQIAFDNGNTRYVVFGRTIRTNFEPEDNNPPGGGDGVVVLRNGVFQAIQQCRADSDQSYYGEESEAALQRLPEADDLFTDETARVDDM